MWITFKITHYRINRFAENKKSHRLNRTWTCDRNGRNEKNLYLYPFHSI